MFRIDENRILIINTIYEIRLGLLILPIKKAIKKLREIEYVMLEKRITLENKLQEFLK